jgi:hypothetical protein
MVNTLILLFILACMVAFMLVVFGIIASAFISIIAGARVAPMPAPTPESVPAGPTWTIKYKEDRKTRTMVISANSEADAIKMIMKMGIRFDSISSLTRNQ